MPSPYTFLPGAVGQGQARTVYGEVGHPAPTSFADPLVIMSPDWSTTMSFQTVANWPADHGSALPAVGDPALLEQDSSGLWHVAEWGHPTTTWGGVMLPTSPPSGGGQTMVSDGAGGSTWSGSGGGLYQPGDLITSVASARAGCLLCNGATYLAASYPSLAANCPNLVSGANLTVPDFQGRVIMGAGTGSGLTARSVGDKGGVEAHKLTGAQSGIAAHSTGGMSANDPHQHSIADTGGFAGGIGVFDPTGTSIGYYQRAGPYATVYATATSVAHTHAVTAADAASTHPNVQPYGVANVFIKT